MTNVQIEIMVMVVGVLLTAGIFALLILKGKLVEHKTELQEELVNIYTPYILKDRSKATNVSNSKSESIEHAEDETLEDV